jgi:hypothetical protein
MAYVPLPAYRVAGGLDFGSLNDSLDFLLKEKAKNKLLQDNQAIGQAMLAPGQMQQPNALLGRPSPAAQPSSFLGQPSPAAQMQSGSLVDRITGAESSGDANATNPNSSATGLGQFTKGTWLDTIKRSRPDLVAGKSDDELLALRTDPNLSREMTGAYASGNAQTLRQAGYEDTPGNTYLAHFAGPTGAMSVLRADPSTPVNRLLTPQAVAANPFLANMTASDLRGWADKKMGGPPAAPPQQQAAPSGAVTAAPGPNYDAAIAVAAQQGNLPAVTQLTEMKRQAEQTARQGRLDERQLSMDAQTTQLNSQKIQEGEMALHDRLAMKAASIAQTIETQPEAIRAGLWAKFVGADPRIAQNLVAHGIDPSDHATGSAFMIAEARGLTAPQLQEVSPGATLVDKNNPTKPIFTAPRPPQNLSTAERKEVFESDAAAQSGNSAIMTLKQALALNDKAYSGFGAETAGFLGSQVGGESGKVTRELENLITAQALDQLKATFGAAPTEGERKILLDIQGSVTENRDVRKKIWERAVQMAQRRVDFNKTQSQAIRSGEYFKSGFSPVTPDAAPPPADATSASLVRVNSAQEAQSLIQSGKLKSGDHFTDENGIDRVVH